LRVFFGDKPIATDVTAAQVVVWNNGRQPIKPPDVLRELKITTEPRVPILEATVRQQTREVIDFALDTSRLAGGEVGLHFRILERSDGAIVQLIYAGRPDHSINVDGVIEAQGTPRSMDLAKRPRDRTVLVLFATSVLFSLATLTSLVGDVHREWPMRNRTPYHRTSIRVSVALILILVLYSGWLLSTVLLPSFLGTEGPPFPIPRK